MAKRKRNAARHARKNRPEVVGQLSPFSTIDASERFNVLRALNHPLSGYLGGNHRGGDYIRMLSRKWELVFEVEHAIPCNSATSGLMAACMAAGVRPGDWVLTTSYSMSATAACAKVLGANVGFLDIEPDFYGINPTVFRYSAVLPKALIVVNLFGHPARLSLLRKWCDLNGVIMIEDNAQSPFAKEGSLYAGTIGHIGVFSLNVHKHIQCGEGGVVVTRDPGLAELVKDAINHGELNPVSVGSTGLNLRMTETTAAIAFAQLCKAKSIITQRVALAHDISAMTRDISWVDAPKINPGCTHVFYMWAGRCKPKYRKKFVSLLQKHGFPMREGYSTPLYRIFNPGRAEWMFPQTEQAEMELITYEICAYSPTRLQIEKMRDVMMYAAEKAEKRK